ncbi:MAG: nuclear transport factor 2 family protein [Sneathiellaceae bacterium]
MRPSEDAKAEIDRVARLIPEHFNAGDMAAIGPLYTVDCVFMVHGAPAMTGRQAVVDAMAGLKADGTDRLETWRVEVQSDGGNGAVEHGGYRMFDAAGRETDRGKYIVLWKKTDGAWLLHWDIFNSDLPAMAAE